MHSFKEKIAYFISKKANYPFCPPKNVTLTLNYICNQKCIMCGIRNLSFNKEHEIRVWEIERIIDEMVQMRIPELVLTGGEPFLYEGIFEVIKYANQKSRKIIMITNGFYPDIVVDKIIDSSVEHLQISLDGSSGEVYDLIRGVKGSFGVVIKNIKKLISSGKSVGATVTITKQNFRDLISLARLAQDIGCSRLAVRPAHVNNADPLNKDFSNAQFWITPEEISEFKTVVDSLTLLNRETNFLDFPPGFELLTDYFRNGYLPPLGSCFIGFTRLIISYNEKSSYGVWMCEDMVGDIRKESLKDIWYGRRALKLRKKIKNCARVCLFPEMHEPGLRSLFSLSRDVAVAAINRINS